MAGRDLSNALFGQPQTADAWRQNLGLDSLEQQYGLPAGLLTSVLRNESSGNPAAYSPKGAEGLFQFMPGTAAQYGINAYDPQQAAQAAAQELSQMYRKYGGDVRKTLAGWNWGQGNLDQQGFQKAPPETQGFIQRVTGLLRPGQAEAAPAGRDLSQELFGTPPVPQAPPPAPAGAPSGTMQPPIDIRPRGTTPPAAQEPGTMQEAIAAIRPAQPVGPVSIGMDVTPGGQLQPEAQPGWTGAAKTGGAMLSNVAGTVGGGALAGLVSPGLAPAGAAAGSMAARKFNVWAGLEEPGVVGDVASLVPLAPYAARLGKVALYYTRAGRAEMAAQQGTAEDAAKYLVDWNTAKAKVTAENQVQLEKYNTGFADDMMTYKQRMADQQARRDRWDVLEQDRQARYAQRVIDAQQEALDATAAKQAAYQEAGRTNYAAAEAFELQKQREYRHALSQYEDAVKSHREAIQEAQSLPQQYLPQMPARTASDVRRDMALLDQGGIDAQRVLQRLNVTTPEAASAKLMQEGEALYAAGGGMGSTPQPRVVQPSEPLAPRPSGPELQQFIRQQGGIKVSDEELRGEFAGVLSRKETGIGGLQNNTSGKTAQQLAEAAQEQGYISTADKASLLAALRESVTEGKPVYKSGAMADVPTPAGPAVPRLVGSKPGDSVSRQLYQRFADIAGGRNVDLSPAHEVMAGLQERLQYASPQFQKIAAEMQGLGTEIPASRVHEMMKTIGQLTQSSGSETRSYASQLFGALHDAMAQSIPAEAQLLQQAKAAWRQERGVEEIGRIVGQRTQGSLIRNTTAGPVMNMNRLLDLADNPKVLRWFPPEEQARFKADIQQIAGKPGMPKTAPVAPDAAPLPGAMSMKGMEPPTPVAPNLPGPLAQKLPPYQAPVPKPQYQPPTPEAMPPYAPPAAREPELASPRLFRILQDAGWGAIGGAGLGWNVITGAATLAGLDVGEYVLSKALLNPQLRPMIKWAIKPNGIVDVRALAAVAAGLRLPWATGQGTEIEPDYSMGPERQGVIQPPHQGAPTARPIGPLNGNIR